MKRTAALLAFLVFFVVSGRAVADQFRVAVAANFREPLEKLSEVFRAKSGHIALISSGSSGKLSAQITNGAPFDIFLGADAVDPERLVRSGAAVDSSQFVYALGRLVLWTAKPRPGTFEVLSSGQFRHLAIAQPELAPYGKAAKAFLESKGLWKKLQDKLVFGESVAQTFQFVETGNAELGFVALSQVQGRGGSYWLVPVQSYPPLNQEAVLLRKGKDSAAAREFLSFLKTEEARDLIRKLGYGVPLP